MSDSTLPGIFGREVEGTDPDELLAAGSRMKAGAVAGMFCAHASRRGPDPRPYVGQDKTLG